MRISRGARSGFSPVTQDIRGRSRGKTETATPGRHRLQIHAGQSVLTNVAVATKPRSRLSKAKKSAAIAALIGFHKELLTLVRLGGWGLGDVAIQDLN